MIALFIQLFNILKETVNRLLGIPDLLLYLVGVRPRKRLKMRVIILRDERGLPVAKHEDAMPVFDEALRIFARGANVMVEPEGWRVVTAPHAAPRAALDVHCTDGAWSDDLGEAGEFFRSIMAKTSLGTWTGYGAPVTVFVVRDISGRSGCSLGALTDYVTVEARALRSTPRLLVHEVAHACGLWHSRDRENVMFPKGPGSQLRWWQAAIVRNSRHVTYW